MASVRVVTTEIEPTNRGGAHAHIAALCLEDGRRLTRQGVMARLRAGIEVYHIVDAGRRAEIEIAERCSRCERDYLRTSRDTSTRSHLLRLPDC